MGVQATWVGQHPQLTILKGLVLGPDNRAPATKCLPKCGDTKHGNHRWPVELHQRPQTFAAAGQLGSGELIGPGGCHIHDVGDRHPGINEGRSLGVGQTVRRIYFVCSDPGHEHRRPESIARTGEMGVHRRRPQPRIDPDEQQPDVVAEQVVNGCSPIRLQFCLAESTHAHQVSVGRPPLVVRSHTPCSQPDRTPT